MYYLDHTLETPAENLALEESLLHWCETQQREVLRFWESPVHFVVLGAGRPYAGDSNVEVCTRCDIPILRRCSGGGTVLQGPGCLNYTLIIERGRSPDLDTIAGTNEWVLTRVIQALHGAGAEEVQLAGTSDLVAPDGKKFSGNAQRRRKGMVLFHGTILYNFDLDLLARCLCEPDAQPEYRARREHQQFVRNISIDPIRFRQELATSVGAAETLAQWPASETADLVRDKYSLVSWNRSF